MLINKDTKIYCSFSSNPGNNGCEFFNNKFQDQNINAIYKSFYSDNIEDSIKAVKTLDIKGFAISMPFKVEVLNYVDELSQFKNEYEKWLMDEGFDLNKIKLMTAIIFLNMSPLHSKNFSKMLWFKSIEMLSNVNK